MNTTPSSNIHRTAKNPFFPYIDTGKLSQVVIGLSYELNRQLARLNCAGLKKIAPCPASTSPKEKNAFIALNAVIKNRPEVAMMLLDTLSTELAQENYAYAQLNRAFTTSKLNHLPDPEQLMTELQKICAVDSFKDKSYLRENLTNLIGIFLRPVQLRIEMGEHIEPAQVHQLLNLSVVLLKGLGKLASNKVTTVGKFELEHLNQLISFYDVVLKKGPPIANKAFIQSLHNFLHRKIVAISIVKQAPQNIHHLDDKEMRDDWDVISAALMATIPAR